MKIKLIRKFVKETLPIFIESYKTTVSTKSNYNPISNAVSQLIDVFASSYKETYKKNVDNETLKMLEKEVKQYLMEYSNEK